MSSTAEKPKPARTGKGALEPVFTSATTLFLILIVAMANYLAFRHYERFDWTSEGIYTLSDKSKSVLKDLKQHEITIYLFMSQNEGAFEDTEELLARYKALAPNLSVRYVDPDREPGEFKILSQRFGILQGMTEMGESRADVAAVVTAGEKKWHIGREDLVGFDFGNMPGVDDVEVNIKAEQALTGALVQVTSGRATRVCVTTGHGEISLNEQDERSITSLKTGLRHDNIELQPLETLGKTSVPAECDAVLVLGPQRAFSEPEAKLLIDHVKAGGRVLLALDPVIEHDIVQPTGFEAALEALSIRLDRSVALELSEERLLAPNPVEFLVTDFGDHETTAILRGGARVLVSLARSFSLLAPSERVEVLMRTSDKSFAATDIARVLAGQGTPTKGAGDVAGPVDLALAYNAGDLDKVDDDGKGGRLILIGDSDFLQGPLLEAPELANFHLMSAFIGHLTERKALVEIPAKKVKGGTIMFTQEDLAALLFRVGVLIPGAAFLLGLAVWLNRRS